MLAAVGNPQHAFKSIHIGGTNGKGSVAATVAAILRADGHRVGLYTSPHLCTFRERIQIDGQAISEADLLAAAHELWPHIQELKPSFFEATTAIGFLALKNARVQWGVIEVGLGGRLDSTNVITPEVSVITNIAMDHSEYLGNTIEKIAREKAGIIKPGVPLLTAEEAQPNLDIFAEYAGGRLTRVESPTGVSFDRTGTRFHVEGEDYKTPLIGEHQAKNATLAIRAAAIALAGGATSSAMKKGVTAVKWPGRLEIKTLNNQTWVFDVAHNVAGVSALTETLQQLDLPKPLIAVIGILGDKDWKAMLPPIFNLADECILTRPPTAPPNRAWDPESVLTDFPGTNAHVLDFTDALRGAVARADKGTILVTGSFHTVGDAMIALDLAPFGSDVALPHL